MEEVHVRTDKSKKTVSINFFACSQHASDLFRTKSIVLFLELMWILLSFLGLCTVVIDSGL